MEKKLTTSEKVKLELSRKKMTQNELAEKLNLDKMTISKRMNSNAWKAIEIYYMQNSLGFDLE